MKSKETEKKHISEFGKDNLPIQNHIIELICVIREKYCVLVAGGAVRDHLLGKQAKDIDLCTEATPDELIQLLESRDIKVKPVGQAFGVVIAMIRDENEEYEEIEIATFRTDGDYSDGRRPDSVAFIRNPAEDAARRDLTINGLFYDPSDHTVIDYVGGVSDMENNVLRFIGTASERIKEDKLRMLRYVRFLLRTGFTPDEQSVNAMREYAESITAVSAERIKDELNKIFKIGPISKALKLLKEFNLLKHVLPEVSALSDCKQGPPYHMEGDVFRHTCMVADNLPANSSNELNWAAILHDIGKPATRAESICHNGEKKVSFLKHDKIGAKMADEICRRLKFSNEERSKIIWLIENHMHVTQFAKMRPVTAKRFMLDQKLEGIYPHFYDLLSLAHADENGAVTLEPRTEEDSFAGVIKKFNEIRDELNFQKESGNDPSRLINGKDVMTVLNINKGGPIVGKILKTVQDRLLEMKAPTKKDALRLLHELVTEDNL